MKPISERIPNAKHRLFIDELFKNNQNATRAYMAVYGCSYEVAMANSSRLLRNAKISEEIEYRLKENAMSANEVLYRLADQARGNIADFATIEDGSELVDHPQAHIVKKFKKRRYVPRDESQDPYEDIELELYDAHAALVDIGRRHSLFTDKIEHSGSVESKLVVLPAQDASD